MQCSCGASLASRVARNGKAVLQYGQCPGCGRVGGELLYISGELVATDTQARTIYQQQKGEQ